MNDKPKVTQASESMDVWRRREALYREQAAAVQAMNDARSRGDEEAYEAARARANAIEAEADALPEISSELVIEPYYEELNRVKALPRNGRPLVVVACSECDRVVGTIHRIDGHDLFVADMPSREVDEQIRDRALRERGRRRYSTVTNAVMLDVDEPQRDGPVRAADCQCPKHGKRAINESALREAVAAARSSKTTRILV